jgi:hypothetical protein
MGKEEQTLPNVSSVLCDVSMHLPSSLACVDCCESSYRCHTSQGRHEVPPWSLGDSRHVLGLFVRLQLPNRGRLETECSVLCLLQSSMRGGYGSMELRA